MDNRGLWNGSIDLLMDPSINASLKPGIRPVQPGAACVARVHLPPQVSLFRSLSLSLSPSPFPPKRVQCSSSIWFICQALKLEGWPRPNCSPFAGKTASGARRRRSGLRTVDPMYLQIDTCTSVDEAKYEVSLRPRRCWGIGCVAPGCTGEIKAAVLNKPPMHLLFSPSFLERLWSTPQSNGVVLRRVLGDYLYS